MATIGTVTKHDDGRYEGELKTLSVRADITVMPVTDKATHNQPDFRVLSKGVEIGAGWLRIGQMSGKEYVSLSIADHPVPRYPPWVQTPMRRSRHTSVIYDPPALSKGHCHSDVAVGPP
jgi:uncharacterized protein (DUF736 family)